MPSTISPPPLLQGPPRPQATVGMATALNGMALHGGIRPFGMLFCRYESIDRICGRETICCSTIIRSAGPLADISTSEARIIA